MNKAQSTVFFPFLFVCECASEKKYWTETTLGKLMTLVSHCHQAV